MRNFQYHVCKSALTSQQADNMITEVLITRDKGYLFQK